MYVPSWDLSNPRYKTENKRKQIKHADTKWTEQNETAHNEENVLYKIEKLLIIGTEIRSFYFYKWERGALTRAYLF